jgi:hypothetical protein
MAASRVLLIFAISVVSGIVVSDDAVSQEYRGTMAQQMACTPDVWRLCGAQVPDVDRIVACLRRKSPQLSEPCRAVIASNSARRDDQPRRYDRDYGDRAYDRGYERPYDRDYRDRSYDRGYERPYDRNYQPGPYEDEE